jgi:antitoxin component of MazEF toxin-antitoxin module
MTMQVEKIKLGEGISIPAKLMQVMNVVNGEELTVLYSEAGMMIIKPLSNRTDILSHLLPTEGKAYDSEEYEEYILHRSVA